MSAVDSGKWERLQIIFSNTISLEVSTDYYNMVFHVEVNEESGKSIWKNRLESWKGKNKKNNKKKAAPKAENKASIPPEQQMEETRWVLWEMTQISSEMDNAM